MTDQPATGPLGDPSHPGGPGTGPGGPPAGPNAPGPIGWYSGPVPFQGLVARETVGQAIGRTVAKTLAALIAFGIGLLALLLLVTLAVTGVTGVAGTSARDEDLPSSYVAGDERTANLLLAIPVTGVILGEDQGGSLLSSLDGATYGYDVKADLERAASRNDIKGIVLEMDTPGGTIFGARAIADAVEAYRTRTGRPVVAFVRGLSASGGMYAMAGADRIVADHGTLVGSVGVIFGPLSRYRNVVGVDGGLLGGGVETTGGITEEYITAGRSKDLGNPYRDLTAEERTVLQQGVDQSYGEFVDHVAAGRSLDARTIREQIGALVYDERTAVGLGLVDEVGNRDRAYAAAAEKAGLAPGNWRVERLERRGGGLFGLGAVLDRLGVPVTATDTATDPRTELCRRGATLLAYYGALPAACA